MKKLSTVLLLALVALTACAWTAKGTGTQPAESKPTEPPAVAAVAVCPLPVLNQVNITITDGKTVSMTRNVAPAGGIVSELLDMKDTLKEVTP